MKFEQRLTKLEAYNSNKPATAHIIFVQLGEEPGLAATSLRGTPIIVFTGCPVGIKPPEALKVIAR